MIPHLGQDAAHAVIAGVANCRSRPVAACRSKNLKVGRLPVSQLVVTCSRRVVAGLVVGKTHCTQQRTPRLCSQPHAGTSSQHRERLVVKHGGYCRLDVHRSRIPGSDRGSVSRGQQEFNRRGGFQAGIRVKGNTGPEAARSQFPRPAGKVKAAREQRPGCAVLCHEYRPASAIDQHVVVLQPGQEAARYCVVEDHERPATPACDCCRRELAGLAAGVHTVKETPELDCSLAGAVQRVLGIATWSKFKQRGAAGTTLGNQHGSGHVLYRAKGQHVYPVAEEKVAGIRPLHAQEYQVQVGIRGISHGTQGASLGRRRVVCKHQGCRAVAARSETAQAQHLQVRNALGQAGQFHVAALCRGNPLRGVNQVQQLADCQGLDELAVRGEVELVNKAGKGQVAGQRHVAAGQQAARCPRNHGSGEALT